jgi:hypothetical protein
VTLYERLRALAAAPAGADLAELLGVEPGEVRFAGDGLTVGGETVSLADCRRALAAGDPPKGDRLLGPPAGGRRVEIGDLCRSTNSPK